MASGAPCSHQRQVSGQEEDASCHLPLLFRGTAAKASYGAWSWFGHSLLVAHPASHCWLRRGNLDPGCLPWPAPETWQESVSRYLSAAASAHLLSLMVSVGFGGVRVWLGYSLVGVQSGGSGPHLAAGV